MYCDLIVGVCVSSCLFARVSQKHMSKRHEIFRVMLPAAAARVSSGDKNCCLDTDTHT